MNGARQLSTVLRFETGTNDLTPRSVAALDALVSELYLGNYADQNLIIAGFSNSKPASNRHAMAVLKSIEDADVDGLLSDLQILPYSFGNISPLTCDDTAAGKAINNRVEIWVKDVN